jgi:hypothetical protein
VNRGLPCRKRGPARIDHGRIIAIRSTAPNLHHGTTLQKNGLKTGLLQHSGMVFIEKYGIFPA